MEKIITALKGLAIGDFRKKPKNNIIFLGFFVLGALIGIVLFAKPLGSLIERFPKPMMFFFMGAVAGIVLAIALVLPGISVSYMLLVMGLYEQTLEAISNVNIAFLAPLFGGVFLGSINTGVSGGACGSGVDSVCDTYGTGILFDMDVIEEKSIEAVFDNVDIRI